MTSSKQKVEVPPSALTWRFSRSPGPGGQHVNTASTRVELTCDLTQISGSPDAISRIRNRYGEKLRVVASSRRSQAQNRRLAIEELYSRLQSATKVPRLRRATRPTRGSVERRLSTKKRTSERKAERRLPRED